MQWWIWAGIGIAAAIIILLAIPPLIYQEPSPIMAPGGQGETETIESQQQQQQQPGAFDEGPGLGDRPLVGDQIEDELELAPAQ